MMYFVNDQFIGRSLEIYGEFSKGEFDLFKQIIHPDMTVLDIGANIGAHTVGLSKLLRGSGRVIAFEPQRTIYHVLCGNLALNDCRNVEAHLAALGRAPGTIVVPIVDYDADGNFGGLALGSEQRGEAVPLQTIDGLNLTNCNFIKIDVEGMELEVLSGACSTLRRFKPFLYLENDREENSVALIEAVLALGYRLYWHLPSLFNPDNYFKNESNAFSGVISINMLGIPANANIHTQGFREILSPNDKWNVNS